MCVKGVFKHDVLMRLMRGGVEERSSSSRVTNVWQGALAEFRERINNSCHNLVIRGGALDAFCCTFRVRLC